MAAPFIWTTCHLLGPSTADGDKPFCAPWARAGTTSASSAKIPSTLAKWISHLVSRLTTRPPARREHDVIARAGQ
eukprot:856031-Alexandrium_andersonii.AAC.1